MVAKVHNTFCSHDDIRYWWGGVKAWATDIYLMDEYGHAITKDQIADKSIEFFYKWEYHYEGVDPDDNGHTYVCYETYYLLPYESGFKTSIPSNHDDYIEYDTKYMCGKYARYRYYKMGPINYSSYNKTLQRTNDSFDIFSNRTPLTISVAKDVLNYYKNGGFDKYISQIQSGKNAADAYSNEIYNCYKNKLQYNGKSIKQADVDSAKSIVSTYQNYLNKLENIRSKKSQYIDILERYINWNWPETITYNSDKYKPTAQNLYYIYNRTIREIFYYALSYSFSYGGWHYALTAKVNGVEQSNVVIQDWFYSNGHTRKPSDEGAGYAFIRVSNISHTHNSNGTDYNQGNDNQHIKYTYCDGHGSDHSQNRSSGTWENHNWVHISNTQDQCTACKRTRTRTYWNDINVYHPDGRQLRDDGNCGWGYIKISNDGTNWSGEVTNENDMTANRTYGSRIYVKYIRPFYDYLEFGSITADGDIVSAGTNTWYHTVTGDSQSINIYMQYKHTTLTLDPNGGTINGNSSPQTLSPQMQYSTSNWWDVSSEMPIHNGYTFEGWYDAATGGTKVYDADGSCIRGTKYFDSNGNSLCVNDLTVYAHWKINTYNIYYTLYGSNASLQRTYTVESNNFALPTNPTLQGYTFKGWIGGIDQKDSVKKGNTYQTPTQNITVEKGSYGDYFFRAVFEKTHSVTDGINIDDVYIAQSIPHEKQY